MKKQEEYKWLNNISCDVTKQAIKDCCEAYKRFFKGLSRYPKFKTKKHDKLKFYQDNFKIQFKQDKVYLSGIGFIKLAEKNKFPIGKGKTKEISVMNPRCSFDGLNWWISVTVEFKDNYNMPHSEGIGIDLGIKDLAICSDGNTYENINKTKKVKILKNKQRRLQRKISRKYLKNKKGVSSRKTNNIIKLENKLLKVSRRLTNIRNNYLHQITTEIINRKPIFIVLENLNVKGMMKNKNLARAIQEQCLYEFYRQINYKSLWNNIKFIEADRYYASSKLCSECGAKNTKLKLSDREWVCEECGTIHDRDFNASVNLKNYGCQ